MVRERGAPVVRKTFHEGPYEVRAAQARREFTRLERFAVALNDVPGAACPRPLELLADPPGVRMEHAAGVDLFAFLAHHRFDAATRARVADTIAAGIAAYVRALREPLPDFKFDNLLYQPAAGLLTFVDLGAPQDALELDDRLSPYEVMMGDLLGYVVFQSARPKYALRRRQHAETAALAAAVLRALRGAELPLREPELVGAAQAAYRRCALGRSLHRSAWYASVGYLLGRRVALQEATVGPLAPWRIPR